MGLDQEQIRWHLDWALILTILTPVTAFLGLIGTMFGLNPLSFWQGAALVIIELALILVCPMLACKYLGVVLGWSQAKRTLIGLGLGLLGVFLAGILSAPILLFMVRRTRKLYRVII